MYPTGNVSYPMSTRRYEQLLRREGISHDDVVRAYMRDRVRIEYADNSDIPIVIVRGPPSWNDVRGFLR